MNGGFKERTNATYDVANGVMAGNAAMNPLNNTSMTASGMSLQNNGLVGQRQIPLNKFSRSGMRGAGLLNKNAASK